VVEADIGAFQHERGVPQRLRFDVVVEVRPEAGPLDDDVDRILSYEKIIEAIQEHDLDRVVVAACSPQLHEPTFRVAAAQAGLKDRKSTRLNSSHT